MPRTVRTCFGIRAPWHPVSLSNGASGRATIVNYKRERAPWLRSGGRAVAVIDHSDFSLKLVESPEIGPDLLNKRVFSFLDQATISLSALEEFLAWPLTEAVYTEFTGYDLAEAFPSRDFAKGLMDRWAKASVPGWWYIDRGALGISFISELVQIVDGRPHAVEISDRHFVIYKNDLLGSSALADKDKIRTIRIDQLHFDRLTALLGKDDAINVRVIARYYRYWLYELALESELPF